jgi:ZIP family zinc transporter
MSAAIAVVRRLVVRPERATRSRRLMLGVSIVVLGAIELARRSSLLAAGNPAVGAALEATAVTALATAIGALPVLALTRIGESTQRALLGFGGGVMLAAAILTLILPAFEAASALSGTRSGALALVASGLAVGAFGLASLDRALPHQHLGGAERKRALLVALAIALHNLPEGLAVGVAAAGGEGAAVTLGIALQNVPEGLVVAAALASLGVAPVAAVAAAIATGLIEPVGGVVGALIADVSAIAAPWALSAAAGAMLFVVGHEIVPALRRAEFKVYGAAAAVAGIAVMVALDAVVG